MSLNNFERSTENLFDFEPSQAGVETNSALIFEEVEKVTTKIQQTAFLTSIRQPLTQYMRNLMS